MIKANIKNVYLHQYITIKNFNNNVYLADYTKQTINSPIKRGVEFFSPMPPNDIDFFSAINQPLLEIDGIEFNNSSFTYNKNKKSRTQCESVIFPTQSTQDSWVLFCELKYSSLIKYNQIYLEKAIKQLYKTRYYYIQRDIITFRNTSYLIASLPQQSPPFKEFMIPNNIIRKLKRERNIILRFLNKVEIVDDKIIHAI